jgi:hypothetical protein
MLRADDRIARRGEARRHGPGLEIHLRAQYRKIDLGEVDARDAVTGGDCPFGIGVGEGVAEMPAGGIRMALDDRNRFRRGALPAKSG